MKFSYETCEDSSPFAHFTGNVLTGSIEPIGWLSIRVTDPASVLTNTLAGLDADMEALRTELPMVLNRLKENFAGSVLTGSIEPSGQLSIRVTDPDGVLTSTLAGLCADVAALQAELPMVLNRLKENFVGGVITGDLKNIARMKFSYETCEDSSPFAHFTGNVLTGSIEPSGQLSIRVTDPDGVLTSTLEGLDADVEALRTELPRVLRRLRGQ